MINVLHVVSKVDPGGIELWLLALFEEARIQGLQHLKNDILVQKKDIGSLALKFENLGVRFHIVDDDKNIIQKIWGVYKIYQEGNYNAVHSHVHHSSGFFIFIAWIAGVKNRISHVHSDRRNTNYEKGFLRNIYLWLMKKIINIFSTKCFAVSYGSAESLYGAKWRNKTKVTVLYCGVKIDEKICSLSFREKREKGEKGEDIFIGHVGRFCEAKNHDFLIDIFYKARRKNKNLKLLLMGDGELKKDMELKVEKMGIQDSVIFTGFTEDVKNILASVVDCFVFPSIYEGLPLSVVEAQLIGLKVIISKNITDEVIISNTAKKISLDNIDTWVQELAQVKQRDINERFFIDKEKFNISKNVHDLLVEYKK